jgi:hypothetical protein
MSHGLNFDFDSAPPTSDGALSHAQLNRLAKKNPVLNGTTLGLHLKSLYHAANSGYAHDNKLRAAIHAVFSGRGIYKPRPDPDAFHRPGTTTPMVPDAWAEIGQHLKVNGIGIEHPGSIAKQTDAHPLAKKYNWHRMGDTAALDEVVAHHLRRLNKEGLDEDTLYHRAGSDTNRGKVAAALAPALKKLYAPHAILGKHMTADHIDRALTRLREGAKERIRGIEQQKKFAGMLKTLNPTLAKADAKVTNRAAKFARTSL